MGSGGPRPNSGRKRGTRNKKTILREQRAEREVAAIIEKHRAGEIVLGKDVLARMMQFAEGTTGLLRPTSQREAIAGKERNPDGDWTRFGEWFDRWFHCARELAKYQSPTFRAIAVSAPEEQAQQGTTIDAALEDELSDGEGAARAGATYLRLVKG